MSLRGKEIMERLAPNYILDLHYNGPEIIGVLFYRKVDDGLVDCTHEMRFKYLDTELADLAQAIRCFKEASLTESYSQEASA